MILSENPTAPQNSYCNDVGFVAFTRQQKKIDIFSSLLNTQPKRVKSLNSGQNLSHNFFGLDFQVLLFFQLSGTCLINYDV